MSLFSTLSLSIAAKGCWVPYRVENSDGALVMGPSLSPECLVWHVLTSLSILAAVYMASHLSYRFLLNKVIDPVDE